MTELPAVLDLELLADCDPWSINKERKENYIVRAERAAKWKATSFFTMQQWRTRNQFWGKFPFTVVYLEIPFKTFTRRDPHNYCSTVLKAVIDGLLQSACWPDDTPDYVGHREPRLVVRRGRAIVRLRFDEADEWERGNTWVTTLQR